MKLRHHHANDCKPHSRAGRNREAAGDACHLPLPHQGNFRSLQRGLAAAAILLLAACGSSSAPTSPADPPPNGTPPPGDEFGDLPLDPGELPTGAAPVTDPAIDIGTALSIVPPGQSDRGGLATLAEDVPLLSDLLDLLLDDLIEATGLTPALTRSPHFDDQIAPYWGPTQAPPGMQRADVDTFYKQAPLLAPDGANWASEVRIDADNLGATIRREPDFGVPHVFGDDRDGAFFGAGYVAAEDRMFMMDVLRRAGRGELSQFLGRLEFSFDHDIARAAPYREAERSAQIVQLVERYGSLGERMLQDIEAFVVGVNTWISNARLNLVEVPVEYVALGLPLQDFIAEDILAVATMIQAELGSGGGSEERNVQLLHALLDETGDADAACALYHDMRFTDDPEINVTTEAPFPTQIPGRLDDSVCPFRADFAQRFPGSVLFDPDSYVTYEPFNAQPCGRPGQPDCPGADGFIPGLPGFGLPEDLQNAIEDFFGGLLGGLVRIFGLPAGNDRNTESNALATAQSRFAERLAEDDEAAQALAAIARQRVQGALAALGNLGDAFPTSASNALLINADRTASGNAIAVFGPQVSYFVPQLLVEVAMYGGDIAVRGGTLPGLPYVVVPARGVDFAWSATSSGVDIVDVRVLELCEDPRTSFPGSYRVDGSCRDFDRIVDEWTARWNAGIADPGDPEDLGQNFRADRNVIRSLTYGPVKGFATVNGQPVALTSQRTTYFRELDAAPPFVLAASNDIFDADSFQRAFSLMASAFNWFYVDADDIAFITPSLLPARAETVYPDFPSWGNGEHDWRGVLPFERMPRDVNPEHGFLANWNNQAARHWWPADGSTAGMADRNNFLEVRARELVARGNVTVEEVVEAVSDAAYVDLRGQEVLPAALDILELMPLDADRQAAVDLLRDWSSKPLSDRAQRRDRSGDGVYDDTQAVALMDAWYDPMINATLPQLLPYEDVNGIRVTHTGRDDAPGTPQGQGSAYNNGWYSYLRRAFDMALDRSQHPFRQLRCAGTGTLEDCRQALLDSLDLAIESLGGIDNMANWQANQSADDVVFQPLGLVGVPDQHWINKPTFQKVLQFNRRR